MQFLREFEDWMRWVWVEGLWGFNRPGSVKGWDLNRVLKGVSRNTKEGDLSGIFRLFIHEGIDL